MIIVAGWLQVAPEDRDAYLTEAAAVVEAARSVPGCQEFSLSADLLDPGRVVVLERWDTREDVEQFRGSGPSEEQTAAIVAASVSEFEVTGGRSLTGEV